MDGWVVGWMDRRMDDVMDRQMAGQMDMDRCPELMWVGGWMGW